LNPIGRVDEAGSVVLERKTTGGCVLVTGLVALKRKSTNGRIVEAGCVARERLRPVGRVADAGCEAEERILALSRVVIWITSIGWWINSKGRQREQRRGSDKQHG